MDTTNEEERKIKRYQLEDGDILHLPRTVNKWPCFLKPGGWLLPPPISSSSGLRKGAAVVFESISGKLGQLRSKAFSGGPMMNINPNDIGELEVPLLPIERQRELAERFANGLRRYKSEREVIEKRWENQRTEIYQELFTGGN